MNIHRSIKKLIQYALQSGLICSSDVIYTTNLLIDALGLDSFDDTPIDDTAIDLENILNEILDYAIKAGLCEDCVTQRDLFDTRIMGLLVPRPSEVIHKFWSLYSKSPKSATDYFYKLSCDSNYIRRHRIAKDKKWVVTTQYGDVDITINLSKPEKDPMSIAAAKSAPQSGYPKCQLCKENEGYSGNVNSPARQNHRIIPLELNETEWFMQYSPYVYYNEHCIVFNSCHTPMKIEKATFKKLLDFAFLFPHYFIGSNADLPIVGGSILSHDHFQGGRYDFAMAKAPIEKHFSFAGFDDVEAGIVKWPMSTIRLRSACADSLVNLADKILTSWRSYSDESDFVFAHTLGEAHNTITPIARKNGSKYELDLVLRNNITTPEHPLGVYHPHAELHNIKKENIGLIEVMGLAVLPARLDGELDILADAIANDKDISKIESVSKHHEWVMSFIGNYPKLNPDNIHDILKSEVGKAFVKVLEHAGVFKRDAHGTKAFLRFINQI
ncbi:MAG: UDP-glucose--hexose-1-phosphate uridylyltransferase [Clostridia bacterium]|nr:UDP-glucose--hexose-1-phosphate uridylyltransferase [Clostridia bacterium]